MSISVVGRSIERCFPEMSFENLLAHMHNSTPNIFADKEPETAKKLKDLPSISDLKFVSRSEFWLGDCFGRVKVARTKHLNLLKMNDEWAYHCPHCEVWIQGLPEARASTSGVRFFCIICNLKVGSEDTRY